MDEGRLRKIIRVDMDVLYASVKRRDNPALKGKPVAIGYPAKRDVVAAATAYLTNRDGVIIIPGHEAIESRTPLRLPMEGTTFR
jgi:hypothetical protein